MQLTAGCVARSLSGRDAGRFYAVLSLAGGKAEIADGKVRRLERPKRKNPKHLAATETILPSESLSTNNQLKRALQAFNAPEAGVSNKGG